MLNNLNIKSGRSLWGELVEEIQWACRQNKPGKVAEGSLRRKKGTEADAGFSRVRCLFESSSPSLRIGKERPFQSTARWGMLSGNRSVLAYPRPGGATEFCQGLGASEQLLACAASVEKQYPETDQWSRWWKKGVGQGDPCLHTEKAAALALCLGCGP